MIKQKIILDKKGIANKTLITIIIVVFVIAAVAMFLFRTDINSYIRNLPGYSVPDEDEEIDMSDLSDEEIKDLCPEIIGKINVPEGGVAGIGAKQYIFIDDKKTDLYWSGDKKEGFIKFEEGDVKLAEIKKGIIFLNSGFFNSDSEFDFDSEDYQKVRFILKMDILDFVKLNNSYYAGNNLLCKTEKDEIKINYGFPEELINLSKELLKLEKVERGFFGMDKGLKIDFAPYIILPVKSKVKFLYVLDGKDYLEIKGAVEGFFGVDVSGLGRIYYDGSVWLDDKKLTAERMSTFEEPTTTAIINDVSEKFREIYQPYYESNLRVNYEEIKELIK